VESAKWNKKLQEVTITMKEGKTLDKAACEKALEDEKYTVRSFVKVGEEKTEEKKEEKKEEEKKEGGSK